MGGGLQDLLQAGQELFPSLWGGQVLTAAVYPLPGLYPQLFQGGIHKYFLQGIPAGLLEVLGGGSGGGEDGGVSDMGQQSRQACGGGTVGEVNLHDLIDEALENGRKIPPPNG